MINRRQMLSGFIALPLVRAEVSEQQRRVSDLISVARAQIGETTRYVPSYRSLAYPMGDFTRTEGVCTDVIIRAFRDAFRYDFQKAVHEDMSRKFSAYPQIWGLSRPDKNIDHRRVPNLETWLSRNNLELPKPARDSDWQPGDLYTMRLGGRLPHIAIVSDRRDGSDIPFVIHNIGRGTREENLLGAHPNVRRFRFIPAETNLD